ncbi:hypothetical protein AHOG_04655 [Actinoalloteichus hoggarensis]|uniref:Uncharacterized protein n=2 Tax=Actinoalloteichus hoggarensis TaxID=1470176 RepID=A0A221VYK7_9PSEU|nr:hypothetical protein AHOG_04655 [Actinoalloteichus hoggarensis]
MVLAVLGIGVLVATGRLLPFQGVSTEEVRTATAVVIRSADCGVAGARDRVEVQMDARFLEADLAACGHTEGARLDVEVIEADPESDAEPEVWLAGTATGGPDPGERMTAVLLTIAGLAGAALAIVIGRPRRRAARVSAANPASSGAASSGVGSADAVPGGAVGSDSTRADVPVPDSSALDSSVPGQSAADPAGSGPVDSTLHAAYAYDSTAFQRPAYDSTAFHPVGSDVAGYDATGYEAAGYDATIHRPAEHGSTGDAPQSQDSPGYDSLDHDSAGYGSALPDLGVSDLYAPDSSSTGRLPVLDESAPPERNQEKP